MSIKRDAFLPVLVLIITIISADYWLKIPVFGDLLNTFVCWVIYLLTIICILWYKKIYFKPTNKKDYRIITIYFIWALIGIIRGCFIPENYWEWKQLVLGIFSLSIPIFVYAFSIPKITQNCLRYWMKYALWAFLLFFMWLMYPGTFLFYLCPVLLLASFIPVLPNKYKIIFLFLLLLTCFISFGARSQVIKSVIALSMCLAFCFRSFISLKLIKLAHAFFYLIPIVLIVLGVSGTFNIFEDFSKNEGKYTERRIINGELVDEDLSNDTRTFIYIEVIESAIRHNYVWFGRTPARGNDSVVFGAAYAEDLRTGKYERYMNEVCHPNIFTWLGIIGMVLYSLIYIKSSYLAVYKSNNIFMKFMGIYVAFNWAYGWVENVNKFDILNISIWMAIAMGFSLPFRKMNDIEFQRWIIGIFKK